MGQDPYAYQDYSHMQAGCLVAIFGVWGFQGLGFVTIWVWGFGIFWVEGSEPLNQGFGTFRVQV